jgi:hypothetical protein
VLRAGLKVYRVVEPKNDRLICYAVFPKAAGLNAEKAIGESVVISGTRRPDSALGGDLIIAIRAAPGESAKR